MCFHLVVLNVDMHFADPFVGTCPSESAASGTGKTTMPLCRNCRPDKHKEVRSGLHKSVMDKVWTSLRYYRGVP